MFLLILLLGMSNTFAYLFLNLFQEVFNGLFARLKVR